MRIGLGLALDVPRGPLNVPFAPNQIAGLAMWLDATDASTITQSGSAVSQWNDKSGKGNHVTQATALQKPSYVAGAINGKAAVQGRPDGVNASVLTCADNANLKYTQLTAFSVARRVADLGTVEAIAGKYLTTGNMREFYAYVSSVDRAAAVGYSSGATTPTATSTVATTLDTATAFIHETVYDGTNLICRLNGGTPVGTALVGVFNGAAPYCLFAQSASAASPFAGYIGEHLFYTAALTSTQRDQVVAYLKSKWGIA